MVNLVYGLVFLLLFFFSGKATMNTNGAEENMNLFVVRSSSNEAYSSL